MNPDPNCNDFPQFNIEIDLPPEYGGPAREISEQVLNHEALDDLQLRQKLIDGAVPTVDTIYR